jgi:hypothetical protein
MKSHSVAWKCCLCVLALLVVTTFDLSGEEPTAAATAQFDSYVAAVEARLAQEHRSPEEFMARVDRAQLRRGQPIIERLTPPHADGHGALFHDWRGSAYVAGAKASDLDRVIRDFGGYPHVFAPQVVRARILRRDDDDHVQAEMRVRQKHVITVVMDMTYDIAYGRLDAQHGYSVSRSTKIAEIADASTAKERALSPQEQHGFLWRLNSYWSYEEGDGGLYMQIESVTLTRSIPTGLGWIVGPFVESVPRESVEFTLRSVCDALRR